MMNTSRLTATALASAFAFTLVSCGAAEGELQAAGAETAVQISPEAKELREEVILTYMEELSVSDDPVAAEEAILDFYSAEEREHREGQLKKYGSQMREEEFAATHPGFALDEVDWEIQDATTVRLSWETKLECGGIEEHGTAFLVDVEEIADGGYEVTRFSHATGCACGTCVQA